MLRRLGLSATLNTGFLVTAGAALVLVCMSALSLFSLKGVLDTVIQVDAQKVDLAGRIQYSAAELLRLENGIILRLMGQDAVGSDADKKRATVIMADLRKGLAQLAPLAASGELHSSVQKMESTVNTWGRAHDEFCSALTSQQYDVAQKVLSDQISSSGEKMVSLAGGVSASVKAELEKARQSAGTQEIIALSILGVVALIALSCTAGVLLVIRGANAKLREVASVIDHGSEQVAASASLVSVASESLARSTNDQVVSLHQTSASSEEIEGISRRAADNMAVAAQHMQETTDVVQTAGHALKEMTASMAEITESSGKISKIIGVIDEIAFQTNILALNAAVEAARAGEAGMGFAVVADEVRNLAHRSAKAARETAELIEESMKRAKQGNEKVLTVNSAVRSIDENSSRVKKLIDEVNVSAREQAAGAEQIARAILGLKKTTDSNAASAQQSATAGTELSSQSGDMKQSARELVALIAGER